MRWTAVLGIFLILAVIADTPVAALQPVPDYEKILQVHLDYGQNGYSLTSMEVKYGKAPNLNIRSGDLKGIILDSGGKELKAFSFADPGVARGDILTSSDETGIIGYTERPSSGSITITIPYLHDMQTFSISDSRDGSTLLTTDLNEPVAAFCLDYSADPDCMAKVPAPKSAIPDTSRNLLLATILSGSVLLAAGLVIWTVRRGTPVEVPQQKIVLVVDDDPDIVQVIRMLLNKKGFITMSASSGKECLGIIRNKTPDLILLDVLMEPMNGWQTLEQIKKDPSLKTIPVLMLTGKRLTAEAAKQYHICIDDYLTKPFLPSDLYTAIENTLERQQKLKETLVIATKAGVDKEKFCELAKLSRRISIDRRIIDILQEPEGTSMPEDTGYIEDQAVIRQIDVTTKANEQRVTELRDEINATFRKKGIPELNW
ncbi:MAG: response regulator [Methanoregula sp.]|jgi:DNA-binding response OmpR family regulator|nr:response regulator [Methanoregula sp.]